MPPFPYTGYLDHCCDVIHRAREYESDAFLVSMIQMQRLVSRIQTAFPSPGSEVMGAQPMTAAGYMTMSATRKELDGLLRNEPPQPDKYRKCTNTIPILP